MADRTSNYRTVRLVLQTAQNPGTRCYYSLHAVDVVRGVPRSVVLADGVVGHLAYDCELRDIWDAIDSAVRQNTLDG